MSTPRPGLYARIKKMGRPIRRVLRLLPRLSAMEARIKTLDAKVVALEAVVELQTREARTLHIATTKPSESVWRDRSFVVPGAPAESALVHSTFCREDDFRKPWFSYWSARLATPIRFHRKLWEFVFICQGLSERGVLKPGRAA